MSTPSENDENFMRAAIEIAKFGKGRVSPNPPVGCVIVKDEKIIGRGFHERCGAAHAEINALADAQKNGKSVDGATAYVSLMPCNHFGKTPPCTRALAAAKIARVVAALDDPNPTSGNGAEFLRENNIAVECGLLADEAAEVAAGFLKFIRTGLPKITVKYAMTLDGKIAQRDGFSRWISSSASRREVQKMRAQSDAILIGANTFRRDRPRLNVRDESLSDAPNPRRIIITSALENIDPQAQSFAEPGGEWIIVYSSPAHTELMEKFRARDVILCAVENDKHRNSSSPLSVVMKMLAEKFGIREILGEGGAKINSALLQEKLADAAAVFIAPTLIGGSGISACEGDFFYPLATAPRLRRPQITLCESDIFIRGEIAYS